MHTNYVTGPHRIGRKLRGLVSPAAHMHAWAEAEVLGEKTVWSASRRLMAHEFQVDLDGARKVLALHEEKSCNQGT